MKINQSYWKENSDDKKSSRLSRAADARRQNTENEANAAAKHKQSESPIKEEMKFAGILKAANNPQKLKQTEEDSSQQRRDDDKKEKRRADGKKDASENPTNSDRIEQYNQSKGGQFGGGGFGAGGNINQSINLSENFAARSILHIADLERMISAIRTQSALGGKREIYLELKRSVLEGLKVKITIDPAARVQIEFLAANQKVRSQIESHSEELAEILRGRGINLQSLRTTIGAGTPENNSLQNDENKTFPISDESANQPDNSNGDNTFASVDEPAGYHA